MRKDCMVKNNNRIGNIAGTILGMGIALLAAQAVSAGNPINLQECMNLAIKNNALLQVAELNRNQFDTKTTQAKAQQLPTVGISGVYTHLGKVTSFSIPLGPGGAMKTIKFGTPENVNVNAKLQMPLFTWGRISGTVALAKAGRALSDIQGKQELFNVTDQVLRAYYAVLLNREVIRVYETTLERAEKQVQTAEKRFKTGNASNLERLRAKMQWTNASGSLSEAKSNHAKSMLFLAKTIGVADTHFTVTGAFAREPFQSEENDLINRAMAGRSELGMLSVQKVIQENSFRVARSGDKPNLYVFSGYSVQNGFNPMEPNKFIENWNAGVQLSIPLFDGFLTRHKTEEARIELKKTALQEKELHDLIRLQVRQTLIGLRQAEDKMTAQTENIEVSREALKTAEIQYENGVISSLDLIDFQQALTQSELLYTQALFNHIMTKLDLCKAVGDYHWFESSL